MCEYAHSNIPPDDQCYMLDDDGFQIIDGVVYRIKVINSKETKCRQGRIGNCLINTNANLVAERQKIGPIKLFENEVHITWLGCTQKYYTIPNYGYTEIRSDADKCWWTADKRYFVSRYVGKIRVISDK